MKKLLLSIASLLLIVPWINAQTDCATTDYLNNQNGNPDYGPTEDVCKQYIHSSIYRQNKYRSKYQVRDKEVRVNLIILQKDDGTGNFQQGDSLHDQFFLDVENSLNNRLGNLISPPVGCSALLSSCYSPNFVPDVGIKFKFNKMYIRSSYAADYEINGTDSVFDANGIFVRRQIYCPSSNWYLDSLDNLINIQNSDSLGINVFFTQAQSSLDRLDSCLDSHPWFSVACSETSNIFQFDKSARVHQPDRYSRYVWNKDCYPYNPLWNSNNLTPAQLYAELVYGTSGGILHELLHQFFSSVNHCNQCPAAMNSGAGGSSRDYLSESNITGVHRALAITKLRKFVVQKPSPPNGLVTNDTAQYDFIEIDQNEVIDFNYTVYQDIVIRTGNTLTVQCKLQMPKMGKIIIEPGAQLIVDEGIITTLGGYYWYGIQIEGSSGPQTTTNQGKLVLKNGALLDNVQYAINFGKEGSWNDFGGIVQAEDATIRVSRRAAAFMTYPHTNNSYFKRCTLEYVTGLTESPLSLVTLWDNHGVNFYGCTFKDETGINQYLDGQNEGIANGIYSIDATYQVVADCNYPPNVAPSSPCPTQYNTRNSFTNFNQGVYATGAATARTVNVQETDFIDNAIGMRVKGLDNVKFVLNNVLTGGVTKNGYSAAGYNNQFGYHSADATGFEIELNVFEKRSNATEKVGGINIIDSKTAANEVYKNTFKQNDVAQKLDALNRNTSPSRSFIGLQFLCNTFQNSSSLSTDVEVNQGPISTLFSHLEGIRNVQGATMPDASAGNVFSLTTSNEGHLRNNTVQTVTYQGHGGTATPTQTTPIWVNTNTKPAAACPSKYWTATGGGIPSGIIGQYYTTRSEYNNLLYNYHQLIDNGNTDSLLQAIGNMPSSEAQQLRDELMAEAPYLSQEVIMDAAGSGILTDAFLLEICLANPDATTDELFLDFLEYQIPNPLSASDIQLIYLSWSGETPRTLIENQLGTKAAVLGRLSSKILHAYALDSTVTEDSVVAMIQTKQTVESKYQLVEYRISKNQFSLATNEMNAIANSTELNQAELDEHNNLVAYTNFRTSIANEGLEYMQLNSAQLETLRGIANAVEGRTATLAQNILCFGYGECYYPTSEPSFRKKKERVYSEIIPPTLDLKSFSVSPNPARDVVNIVLDAEFEIENTIFILTSMEGKEVRNQRLQEVSSIVNISNLAKGEYIYRITDSGKLVAEGKLIKL